MEIIVGKTAGFCYGVKRAVEGAIEEVQNGNKKIYCLGEIVHNKEVVEDLKSRGMEFIDTVDDIVEQNSKTIIRAHGVPKETYEQCKARNIEIVDFTCPNVLRIHEIAKEHNQNGYYIVLVGAKNHPENIGTISFCGTYMSVIEKVEDTKQVINKIKNSGKSKCLVIAQTTYHLGKFEEIKKILNEELPKNIELKVENTICMATQMRQNETEKIAKKVDKMIIIGGKNSSNTKKLFEVASKNCNEAVCVQTVADLSTESISGYDKIGIMAGASTPEKSIEDIVNMIKEAMN